MHSASQEVWRRALSEGRLQERFVHFYGEEGATEWRENYLEALRIFAEQFGSEGELVIARCPGQMNIMGMHIDYGGMPSIRLAVQGRDTISLVRKRKDGRVRMHNVLRYPGEEEGMFPPFEFDLREVLPEENVGSRQALMDYAGKVCSERQAKTGNVQVDDWSILVQGQLVFQESYFRGKINFEGFDGLVWSNVSPSGGMSSSSALVISSACAALGAHGLVPREDMPLEDLVDGVGTSEWIRGTRGGTADHGGMVMGKVGKLVSVGVFPAQPQGEATLPDEYVAVILDSGVPRVYDDAMKEETVIAYPLGTFMVKELLLSQLGGKAGFENLVADFRERIVFIRDITEENLGVSLSGVYQLLAGIPKEITLKELEGRAREAGAGEVYEEMCRRDVEGKFAHITPNYPIFLRRRFVFGLTEQDRVKRVLDYMNAGEMATALELARISHDGDLDREVTDEELADLEGRARQKEERARLCFLPGGYGRMTPEYDRAVRVINEFLMDAGGETAGSVQRIGAGWGGNVGGLIKREFVSGSKSREFGELLRGELGIEEDPSECVAVPGEGACLLEAPEEG